MKMEIGKTYQNKASKSVIEIKNDYYGHPEGQLYYEVVIVVPTRVGEYMKQMLLPHGLESNFVEVVVDSDGLVYQLEGDF